MADLEFYRDENGEACVRGDDERLATFIQTDLQGSTAIAAELIALLEDEDVRSEFNGNAHSLSISAKTVTIEANFDDDAIDRRLDRDEMLQHIKAWHDFIKADAAHT